MCLSFNNMKNMFVAWIWVCLAAYVCVGGICESYKCVCYFKAMINHSSSSIWFDGIMISICII